MGLVSSHVDQCTGTHIALKTGAARKSKMHATNIQNSVTAQRKWIFVKTTVRAQDTLQNRLHYLKLYLVTSSLSLSLSLCVCVCARARVRVRVCACACARARARACVRVRVRACSFLYFKGSRSAVQHFRFQCEESDGFYFRKVQGSATGNSSSRSLQKQISCDQCSVINSSPLLKNSSTVTTGCIPGIGESHITLDSIITEYLTNQHALCKNPMVPCPQFNLFE